MRVVYLCGAFAGFLGFALVVLALRGLGLPAPGDGPTSSVTVGVVLAVLFFASVYGGGVAAVLLVGLRLRARCPRCEARAVTFVRVSASGARYGCYACGFLEPGSHRVGPPGGSA